MNNQNQIQDKQQSKTQTEDSGLQDNLHQNGKLSGSQCDTAQQLAACVSSVSTNSQVVIMCKLCNKVFKKQSKLQMHVQSVHEQKRPYQCSQCENTFKRKDHLDRHVQSVHAVKRDTFTCPFQNSHGCLMSFPNRDQLRKHVARTHENRIQCNLCPQPIYFQKKNQLRKHMHECHGEGYKCTDHCNKKFASRKLLNAHLARIQKIKQKRNDNLYFLEQDSSIQDDLLDEELQSNAYESNHDLEASQNTNQDLKDKLLLVERKEPYKRQRLTSSSQIVVTDGGRRLSHSVQSAQEQIPSTMMLDPQCLLVDNIEPADRVSATIHTPTLQPSGTNQQLQLVTSRSAVGPLGSTKSLNCEQNDDNNDDDEVYICPKCGMVQKDGQTDEAFLQHFKLCGKKYRTRNARPATNPKEQVQLQRDSSLQSQSYYLDPQKYKYLINKNE